ncbi:MAG TPA: hypothetical protein VN841_05925 [Bryobacteraceae bacterium]|nr:hypothetical protein [Bryobacteraceae bacterium]
MRPFTAIAVSLALCFAFVQAPFLHVHQHEATQKHPGAFLHLHLESVHPAGRGPEFRSLDPDDDAQFHNWFSATSADDELSSAILAESVCIQAPEISGWTAAAPLPHGYDPPRLCIKNPRAPPA